MPQSYILEQAKGQEPADEWVRLGVDFHTQGKVADAIEKYRQALRIDPRHVSATMNLAIALAHLDKLNDALLCIERAQIIDGESLSVLTNRCLMATEAGRYDEALEVGRKAVSIAPKTAEGNHARLAFAILLPAAGLAYEAIPVYEDILKYDPRHQAAGANLCFVQTLLPCAPECLAKPRKTFYDTHRSTDPKKSYQNDRNPSRPLRVGYVSGDFKSHSASFIYGGVLLHHTSQIVPYFYSSLHVDPAVDQRTKVFMGHAGCTFDSANKVSSIGDRWRDISAKTDIEVDDVVRKDGIDILVDLAGHTGGGRIGLFTRKPAPIQMCAWGFAHGTGVPEIDYFLADSIAVPEIERSHFVEKVLDIPCIVTIDPPTWYKLKESSPPPIRKNGYITFGVYARFEKMSDICLQTYKRILQAVPDSKIEFKDHAFTRPYSIRRVLHAMQPEVSADRHLFSTSTNHVDHMRAYQQADLCLDPFPHGGGVVAIEQLYMGVPIITLYGSQPSGRTAASLLTLMGRKNWIAHSIDEYVAKAVNLSNDIKTLADSRKVLRRELLESPAVKGYVEAVEGAYRRCWRDWCNG